MTQIEFEVERDAIELSYDEKMLKLRNEFREKATKNADLEMQIKQNEKEMHRINSLLDDMTHERDRELLRLEREYMAQGE